MKLCNWVVHYNHTLFSANFIVLVYIYLTQINYYFMGKLKHGLLQGISIPSIPQKNIQMQAKGRYVQASFPIPIK